MIFMFEYEATKRVIEQARQSKCDVMLIKEEGLLIQAERVKAEDKERYQCYADGFGPAIPDVFQRLSTIFADGSDRCFYFDVDNVVFDSVIEHGCILGIKVNINHNGEPNFLLIAYTQK